MKVAIASGKGGTGKTTISVSMALVAEDAQLLDCDVEEPNAHIFLKPKIRQREPVSIPVPVVDPERCRLCGKCSKACRYGAIALLRGKVLVFRELCHGCLACYHACPEGAISAGRREIGVVEVGVGLGGVDFVQGRLKVGEPRPPDVIAAVKRHAREGRLVILDCPPGTSCPMVEAIRGADFCLLVTEPTPFGEHDLRLAIEVVKALSIPAGVVVNRSDLRGADISALARGEGLPILAEIPSSREVEEAYSMGEPPVKVVPWLGEIIERLLARVYDLAQGR